MVRKYIALMAALAALTLLAAPQALRAASDDADIQSAQENIPGDKSLVAGQPDVETPRDANGNHTPPIRFKSVDYSDAGGDGGKLSVIGEGEPGTTISLFFDQEPLGTLKIGDDGKWNFEIKRQLDDKPHAFRAERYDPVTGMLAGQAMVQIARAKDDGKNGPPTP